MPQAGTSGSAAMPPSGSARASRLLWARLRAAWTLPTVPYLLVFGAALALFLARLAIDATDADIWYHLAAGREMARTGRIPREAFASFLERPWIDYSWLFQLLVWGVHQVAGIGGLVLLRALVFFGLAAATAALLQPWRLPGAHVRAAALVIALLILFPRFASLRPQLLALALLASSLLALERGGRWLFALPLMALLWVNVHGVSWPVLAVVLAAYGADTLWRAVRPMPPAGLRARAAALLVAGLAILVTPHGRALVSLPFVSLEFASRVIEELQPLPAADFAGLVFDRLAPTRQTLFNLLALLTVGALLEQLARRRLRLAHLLLVVGGALLVTRGARFVFEASVLALPLLATWSSAPALSRRGSSRPVMAALLALVAVIPFLNLWAWRWRGPVPLAGDGLPSGVCTFLEREDGAPAGTIFGDPDYAGYLEWRLLPRYRVFSDLQTPFPYGDVDTFLALRAFHDPLLLRKVVGRWRPDLLVASALEGGAGRETAARLGYHPVAFDWTTILYASERTRPELVRRYRLRALDPFAAARGEAAPAEASRELAIVELGRLAAVDPDNGAVRNALGRLELARGRAPAALVHAERVVEVAPRRPQGWQLLGEARLAMSHHREALAAFLAARQRGAPAHAIGRQLWRCWLELDEPRRAYRELSAVVHPASGATTFGDLFALGLTAAAAGDGEAAERNFTFALWIAPDAAAERRALAALLASRGTNEGERSTGPPPGAP